MALGSDGHMNSMTERVSRSKRDEMMKPTGVPRLLVSVRSQQEAEIALLGGADILDVKEPSRGSLGMASPSDITSIANSLAHHPQHAQTPLSVALGELTDWSGTEIPALPAGINFAKLGLSHCSSERNWVTKWLRVRDEFQRCTSSKLQWVAVAYADEHSATAPPIAEVVHGAIETGCAGLLIDTWTKGSRHLLDELDLASLSKAAAECHASGLFIALAGRLSSDLLPRLREVPADVLAIRSAGCRGTDRTAELDSLLISDFRHQMQQSYFSRL